MADSFTETTTESWGGRLLSSIKGVIFGLLLFLASFIVLWWNEGRAVKTAKGLSEGASQVVNIQDSIPNSANDGKLIHLSGLANTQEVLKDPDFPVQANALRLKRHVEMYQWEEDKSTESKKKVGGSKETKTTYTYKKTWDDNLNDSQNFKVKEGHENPAAIPYGSYGKRAAEVKMGGFEVPASFVDDMGGFKYLPIGQVDTLKYPGAYVFNEGKVSTDGLGAIPTLYIGKGTYTNPQVGDVKITFSAVKPGVYSVVAEQEGEHFAPFKTSYGTTISLVEQGKVKAAKMFEAAQSQNTMMTWILRLVGFLMMFGGLMLIFKPLSVVADVVPLFGNLLEMGLGLFSGIVAFALSFVTIAIAWIVYRPILGISLLVVGLGILIFFQIQARKKKAAKSAGA